MVEKNIGAASCFNLKSLARGDILETKKMLSITSTSFVVICKKIGWPVIKQTSQIKH
ncbi:MAG: hypothetical protein ACYSTX_03285 [Planctomycetota bacterium]|jgi:hypothetical protein